MYYYLKQEEKFKLNSSSVFYPVLPVKSTDVQVKISFVIKCFFNSFKKSH